jgi:hypothetical protein
MSEEYGSVMEFMFNGKELSFYIMNFTVKLPLDPRQLISCVTISPLLLLVSKASLFCYKDLQATVSQE